MRLGCSYAYIYYICVCVFLIVHSILMTSLDSHAYFDVECMNELCLVKRNAEWRKGHKQQCFTYPQNNETDAIMALVLFYFVWKLTFWYGQFSTNFRTKYSIHFAQDVQYVNSHSSIHAIMLRVHCQYLHRDMWINFANHGDSARFKFIPRFIRF